MSAGSPKSEYNPCPICGLPRGKGQYEFSHGKCIEQRAKTDGQKPAGLPGKLSRLTVDQVANAKRKHRIRTAAKFNKWLDSLNGGVEYDFGAEHEFADICQHGDCLHVDCERQRPPEIDYAD